MISEATYGGWKHDPVDETAERLGDPRSTILIAGYQAEGTLGRRIAQRQPEVRILGRTCEQPNFEAAITSLWAKNLTFLSLQGADRFRDIDIQAGTNFDPPIRDVQHLLDIAPAADRTLVYMLTDGVAFDAAAVDVAGVADRSIEFYAFQIGGNAVTAELAELSANIDADPTSTGRAIAVNDAQDLAAELLTTIDVESVTVNGQPVEALDGAGNFFTPVTLASGANSFTVAATTTLGIATQTDITLFGDSPGSVLDFNRLEIASATVRASFAGTTLNRATRQLHVMMQAANDGDSDITPPLFAVFDSITTPSVTLADAEGTTGAGQPYVVFDTREQPNSGLRQRSTSYRLGI